MAAARGNNKGGHALPAGTDPAANAKPPAPCASGRTSLADLFAPLTDPPTPAVTSFPIPGPSPKSVHECDPNHDEKHDLATHLATSLNEPIKLVLGQNAAGQETVEWEGINAMHGDDWAKRGGDGGDEATMKPTNLADIRTNINGQLSHTLTPGRAPSTPGSSAARVGSFDRASGVGSGSRVEAAGEAMAGAKSQPALRGISPQVMHNTRISATSLASVNVPVGDLPLSREHQVPQDITACTLPPIYMPHCCHTS